MFRHIKISCAALFFSALAAFGSTNHHVILIAVDGFPAYMFTDPQSPIPTFRKLASNGTWAAGMRVSNPSVTWPNHSTLVTGVHPRKHSVLFNGVLERSGPGMPVRVNGQKTKAQLVAVPTIYDDLYKKGYRTAGINWPATRESGTLHDDFPDVPQQITHSTPDLRRELVQIGLLEDETDRSFTAQSASRKDQIWTGAAAHLIRTKKPNFMAFHMLIVDGTHHRYGAQSMASYTALAQTDAQMAQVLEALEDAGIRDKTTIFVVADHGFEKALKIMNINVLFRKSGLLTVAGPNIARANAQIISEGGTAMLYLINPETKQQDLQKVREALKDAEGLDRIIEPSEFAALGYPDPDKNPQMADLVLTAKQGYAFGNLAAGENYITEVTLEAGSQGHHGFISTNPKMNAVFIASGRGIKKGGSIGVINNIDVAPTIMHLLGQNWPQGEGKVLEEILAK